MKSTKSKAFWIASLGLLLATGLIWNSGWRIPRNAKREMIDPSRESTRTRSADRPEASPERDRRRHESISLAAQKWYEELLEKYPRMKPVFRDVPDEQNGYLQLILFAESLQDPLPPDLKGMLNGNSPWDAQTFKTWLTENQDVFGRILHIAELPDQSAKGATIDGLSPFGMARTVSDFSLILRSSARLAFDEGDQEAALRSMRASTSLANHLVKTETPTLLGEAIVAGIRGSAQNSFRESFLASLASDPVALRSWREAVFPDEPPSAEYSRVMIGEWNTMMRYSLLPALLGSDTAVNIKYPINDVDGFIAASVTTFLTSADAVARSGPDRFDMTAVGTEMLNSEVDPATAELFKNAVANLPAFSRALGIGVTTTAINTAAISILLGETPPVDPVSGKAFSWDPKTRLLSAPEGSPEIDPIKVP